MTFMNAKAAVCDSNHGAQCFSEYYLDLREKPTTPDVTQLQKQYLFLSPNTRTIQATIYDQEAKLPQCDSLFDRYVLIVDSSCNVVDIVVTATGNILVHQHTILGDLPIAISAEPRPKLINTAIELRTAKK